MPSVSNRSARVTAFLAVLFAAGVLFAAVALNAIAAGDGVAARQLERDLREEQRRYDQLVAEVASLEDLDRISEIALGELGLVVPDAVVFLPPPDVTDDGGRSEPAGEQDELS